MSGLILTLLATFGQVAPLSVVVTPPTAKFTVVLKATKPPAGSVVIWTINPREGTENVSRSATEWKLLAPANKSFEVTRSVGKPDVDQVDEFISFTTGDAPKPPPIPPGPGPTPDPDVLTASKLWIVIVEETGEAVAGRGAMLADPTLAAYMRSKGHKFRVVDKDVVGTDGKPPADVLRFLQAAKGNPLPQAFLVDEKGRTRQSFNITANMKAADLLAALKKYEGR